MLRILHNFNGNNDEILKKGDLKLSKITWRWINIYDKLFNQKITLPYTNNAPVEEFKLFTEILSENQFQIHYTPNSKEEWLDLIFTTVLDSYIIEELIEFVSKLDNYSIYYNSVVINVSASISEYQDDNKMVENSLNYFKM